MITSQDPLEIRPSKLRLVAFPVWIVILCMTIVIPVAVAPRQNLRGLWLLLIWVPFFVPAILNLRCTVRATDLELIVIGMFRTQVIPRPRIAAFEVAQRSTLRVQELCIWVQLRYPAKAIPLRITSRLRYLPRQGAILERQALSLQGWLSATE